MLSSRSIASQFVGDALKIWVSTRDFKPLLAHYQ
jgi:hypothetical protein